MKRHIKQPYAPPCVAETAYVCLERDLLVGSIEATVQSAGHEIDGFYEADGSTFNQIWD